MIFLIKAGLLSTSKPSQNPSLHQLTLIAKLAGPAPTAAALVLVGPLLLWLAAAPLALVVLARVDWAFLLLALYGAAADAAAAALTSRRVYLHLEKIEF